MNTKRVQNPTNQMTPISEDEMSVDELIASVHDVYCFWDDPAIHSKQCNTLRLLADDYRLIARRSGLGAGRG